MAKRMQETPSGTPSGPPGGETVKGAPAAEATARHIEALIAEGALRPGDPLLPEREMAARLNVSRPTLRQGIRLLEARGLLVADAHGGRAVGPLGASLTDPLMPLLASREEAVGDYLELRATLERMAATLAAGRATAVDRTALADCVARMDEAHAAADPAREAETDVAFHRAIYEASHNLVLLHIMRALSGLLRTGIFRNREKLYARPEVRGALRDQHHALCDAILAGDAEAAGARAEAHVGYVQRVLAEIAAAEARLEISLRRIDGGSLAARAGKGRG